MVAVLNRDLIDLINKRNTIKILATTDEDGLARAEWKEYLTVNEEGKLQYLELLETARSYKNFVRSLWFDKNISITLLGENQESYLIIGKPEKIHISGELFEEQYIYIREELGDVDLAAVCVIEPISIFDTTLAKRIQSQDSDKPIFRHLDRLIK